MKTIEISLYKFDELSEVAQKNAINELSDINVDYNWWESTYNDAENVGLKITSFDLDRNRKAEGKFLNDAYNCALQIVIEHGENCETHKTAKEFINFWNMAVKTHSNGVETDIVAEGKESYFDDFVYDAENEFLKSILEDYSIILQNESDYLQSSEAIIETILANDYDFTENGQLY